MTGIKHHLTDDILAGYAIGTLPEAFSLVVATHVSLCDECRARLGAYEAVGGGVVETIEEADVSDDALEATLALIERTDADVIALPAAQPGAVFPAPLRDYVGGDVEHARWRSLGGGVQQMVLPTAKGANVRLLKIPGGAQMPDHGHSGAELTLVLQGAFSDADGRFARGDVEVADEGLHHTPVAEEGEDCICLAATDAPLRFKGWLPRIMQPFVGI